MDEDTKLLSDALSFLCVLDENEHVRGDLGQECRELILRLRAKVVAPENLSKNQGCTTLDGINFRKDPDTPEHFVRDFRCCGKEMRPTGLRDCNGWHCEVCGKEIPDMASYKMSNPRSVGGVAMAFKTYIGGFFTVLLTLGMIGVFLLTVRNIGFWMACCVWVVAVFLVRLFVLGIDWWLDI